MPGTYFLRASRCDLSVLHWFVSCCSMKKEAAIMAKEIEKRQKEYIEKQKMKSRHDDKSMFTDTLYF